MKLNENYDSIVIGAGAAGLISAGKAASSGKKVLLIERNNVAGKKLRITGKGRCNVSNRSPISEFLNHFGKNGKFLRQAFAKFFVDDLIEFLKELNINVITERGGRIFPDSQNAHDIVNALIDWNLNNKVIIFYNQRVKKIVIKQNQVTGVLIDNNININAENIIIATGGTSYPITGSTGDGYKWAESIGHKIIPVRPALVPVETEGPIAKQLQGLSLRNIEVSLWSENKKILKKFGEIIFTHFGLSGPVILTISQYVVDLMDKKQNVEIIIDLKPALNESVLDKRILADINKYGKKKVTGLLKGLLPKKLIPVCCAINNFSTDKSCNQISAEERNRLRVWLKNFKFQIKGYRSLKEAIITAGGISLKEINPRTMESIIIKNLYFAGEILDLHADTGGYNLQEAFSTGWIAGTSCC